MAVVTARRGWRVTLRWRIVVRPLPFVFAAVVAAAIAAVIAAVIAVPLFRRSRWLLCASPAFWLYLDLISLLKSSCKRLNPRPNPRT
jgi:hypothetical protein